MKPDDVVTGTTIRAPTWYRLLIPTETVDVREWAQKNDPELFAEIEKRERGEGGFGSTGR